MVNLLFYKVAKLGAWKARYGSGGKR